MPDLVPPYREDGNGDGANSNSNLDDLVERHCASHSFYHRGRTASFPTAPARMPACGITVPGSSEILASRSGPCRRTCHFSLSIIGFQLQNQSALEAGYDLVCYAKPHILFLCLFHPTYPFQADFASRIVQPPVSRPHVATKRFCQRQIKTIVGCQSKPPWSVRKGLHKPTEQVQ